MKTVTISAPLCAPDRQTITGTIRKQLKPYPTFYQSQVLNAEMVKMQRVPQYWRVEIAFSDQTAVFGEYCLLRYGYHLISKPLNPKNPQWAESHLGGKPWYEASCKDRPKNAPPGEIASANPPTPWEVRRARDQKRKLSTWDRIKAAIE